MNKDRFVALIRDFCRHNGIDDAMAVVHGRPVEIDGVAFSLVHSETIDPRLLLVYCDIAPAPVGTEIETYSGLLRKNLYLGTSRGPVFGIAPDTGRILMSHTEELAELTPQRLLERLLALVTQARAWREAPPGDTRADPPPAQRPAGTLRQLRDRR